MSSYFNPSSGSCFRNRRLLSAIGMERELCKSASSGEQSGEVTVVSDSIHIVDSVRRAQDVVGKLRSLPPDTRFACDTETTGINLSNQSPVFNGTITCASIFCGHHVNFGDGSILWIDTLDGEEGTLDEFKSFFQSRRVGKVWHNYSFDRHVLYNHDIDVHGLAGDTMHMARIWDSSRSRQGDGGRGYSLAALTEDLLPAVKKTSMKELFSRPVLKKDGTPGKKVEMPTVEDIQRDDEFRDRWIRYSAYDAVSTLELFKVLKQKLELMDWRGSGTSMFDFYIQKMIPFGHLLTDIEREGFQIDHEEYLPAVEKRAKQEREELINKFMQWVQTCGAFDTVEDAMRMNPSSASHKQRLLYAKDYKLFSCPDQYALARRRLSKAEQEGNENNIAECADSLSKLAPKSSLITVENIEQHIAEGKDRALKSREIWIKGLGLSPKKFTKSGWPQVSADVLKELAGKPLADPPKYGSAFEALGGGEAGRAACEAIDALNTANSIETMLGTFILPLQEMVDPHGRIHCSLNLNTETGRLSSRRPNLQNQPALEKDIYKIRDAFVARPGNTLIVADYGQLELRVLAHMANCKSMITAFKEGGDFHSRTAMGMYDYIAEAADRGEVLLEWDTELEGRPAPAPLIKDVYAVERRKAKVLNFSIAYGKTPMGLAKDWGVSLEEAKDTVDRWYRDRPEVGAWQEEQRHMARTSGAVRTLWGRYRQLPGIRSTANALRSHSERAAINTPIQGSAADIVMAAMIRVHKNRKLRSWNWKMVLQVHDEIILEGPQEKVDDALEIVTKCMQNPFEGKKLRVDLTVDARSESSWYKAK